MIQGDVGVIGAGAVGHMLAFFISQKAKLPVQLLGSEGVYLGAKLVTFAGEEIEVPLASSTSQPKLWFCCLKAHSLERGLRQHLAKLPAGSTLIVLTNGYLEPILQPIALEFKTILFRKGLVTRGVRANADGSYLIGEQGQVIWGGAYNPSELEAEVLLRLAPYGFLWNPYSCQLRREKWFYNTCLNTLCGIYRLRSNGEVVFKHRAELEVIAAEAFLLIGELWPNWNANWQTLWHNLLQLIADTSQNENSMAADLRLCRPTEVNVLSGLVQKAQDPSRYPLLSAWDQQLRGQLPSPC